MGDRAVVLFVDHPEDVEYHNYYGGIYLHWAGGLVTETIPELAEYMGDRTGDASYAAARFVGLLHNKIGGNLSLGILDVPRADGKEVDGIDWESYSHGDQGVYIVDCTTWKVQRRRWDHYDDETWYDVDNLDDYGEPAEVRDVGRES